METITGPFTGMGATLLAREVAQVVTLLPKKLVVGRPHWTYMSESAGPNFKKSTWSAGLDAIAFLRDPLTWYHWFMVAFSQKAWALISWNVATILVSLPVVPLLLMTKKFPKFLGRLVALYEARGKVRVVAITDWWTQVLLKPLHLAIFDILRTIPQDGTFDQLAPVHNLMAYVRASGAKVFSYDLSAATDRLPLVFQVQVLESLGISWAKHWGALLSGRPWFMKGKPVYYAVVQPMGALSSWAMLAITHHILVQMAAHRVGYREWFQHYALLGDDIVIADEAVAKAYLTLMQGLGVVINLSKSFEMASGGLEFAKRWISPTLDDISPMGPGLILAVLRNPRMLSTLILDCLGRGYIFSTRVVSDMTRFLVMIRPRKWLDRFLGPILSSVIGPTGGLWDSASGPIFKAVWIKMFPHRMADKLNELVDILYQLIADSQKPPLAEEESLSLLSSNFWKQVMLPGSNFRGLIWAPLLILSPAFWVYYDLAHKAGERLLEYQELLARYEQALWGREWMTLEGLDRVVRGHHLMRLVRSTFDPDILAWDRQVAEANLRLHEQLFKKYAERVKVLEMSARYKKSFSAKSRFAKVVRYQTIPTNLSLVPLGYTWIPQKITLRHQEVPQRGI